METRHATLFAWGAQSIPFPTVRGAECPWLYVDLFVSPAFINHLVTRTNERLDERSSALTSAEEMTTFLWLRDYMGIVTMPRLKMFWEKDGMFGKKFVRRRMSRDRFVEIQRALSFDLGTLEELILTSCRSYWSPAQRVDLDEAIAPFRGRYRFRVRIIGKPKTTGLKIFTLTDEEHFIYAFRRYAGQQMSVPQTVAEFASKLPHAGHVFYADKWFGGLDSANEVLSRGHRFTFSCNKRRPTALWSHLHSQLHHSDLAVEQTDDPRVLGMVWVDRAKAQPKKVNLLSSRYGIEEASRMIAADDDNEQLPSLVADYRTGKSFGDVANASIAEYSFHHRQRKWTHAGLTFLLHAAMHNAWVLCKNHTGSTDELLDFERRCLQFKLPASPSQPAPFRFHLVARAPTTRNCARCYAVSGHMSHTPYICQTCDVPLHPDCFVDYHK
jgi:Transposase IS4